MLFTALTAPLVPEVLTFSIPTIVDLELGVELEAVDLELVVELGLVAELEPVVKLRLVVPVDVLQSGEQGVLPKLLDLVEAGAEDL